MIKKVIFFLLKLISKMNAWVLRYRESREADKELPEEEKGLYEFRPFELKVVNVIGKGKKPFARSGHRIVLDETYMYSFGGYNPKLHQRRRADNNVPAVGNHCLFKEMWKFHVDKREWRCVLSDRPEMPSQVASNAMLILGNIIFVSFIDCF